MNTKTITAIQVLIVTLGLTYAMYKFLPTTLTSLNIAGLILFIASLILWLTARLQLGNSFSVTPQARALVTHGLYSKIRNPIYVFGALTITGFVLAIGRPIYLLALLIIVPLQIRRIRAESKVLEEKFGDAYRAYRRQTWF